MSDFTPSEVAMYYQSRVPGLCQTKTSHWRGKCPIHNGENDNFAVDSTTGRAYCHSECGRGWDIFGLEMELFGLDFPACKKEVFGLLGRPEIAYQDRDIVSAFDYVNADGQLQYQVIRRHPKKFAQRRPDGNDRWVYSLGDLERVPFNLPAVIQSNTCVIVEGEKDVLTLKRLGVVASCNSEGACKWRTELNQYFVGKQIVIIPDNDKAGREHALQVAASLYGKASRIQIVELPNVPEKADVSDFFAAGRSMEEFNRCVANGRDYTPGFQFATIAAHKEVQQAVPEAPDLLGFLPNDHGNAERLITLYGDSLRYSHDFKKWLVWDGQRWSVDSTGQARKYAKLCMLAFHVQAVKAGNEPAEKFARSSLDAKRIANMLSMAEPEICVKAAELDTDPYLLNFLNGTVDLRTSELRPHYPGNFITKVVHFNYRPDAECPTWLNFLHEIMGGGPDASSGQIERANVLVDYLQRALGYSLTGTTREKAVFVLEGRGNNGKSTMLNTFRQLIEEYATLILVETLMVRHESSNSQADLADLRGARFVQTSETEEGQTLSQGKLKRITQGMGRIRAVKKYENPIEFEETHKLWMDTNSLPGIGNADDPATFKRLHPIPFTVQIPEDRIDKSLPERLLAEAEGILAWAVAGAQLWFRSGLTKPTEVEAAKEQWHSDVDQLGRFVEECCDINDTFSSKAFALYETYKRWAEQAGERSMSNTAFGKKLKLRGFDSKRTPRGNVYLGIAERRVSEDAAA